MVVDRANPDVEAAQDIIGEVERAVFEDVYLDALSALWTGMTTSYLGSCDQI
ncbi:MAG: hypothetical protein ACNA8W_01455 [Bradymonadaceae bacterium]